MRFFGDSFINSSPKVVNRISSICNLYNSNLVKNLKVFKGDIKDKGFIEIYFMRQKRCLASPLKV